MRNRPIPFVSVEDKAFVMGLVIHDDAQLLAFDKPSGLPVQSRGNKARCLDELLWTFAKTNGKRPRLVHRLDAGTSGVIVAARTKPAAAALAQAFAERRVTKTYLALVSGALPALEAGRIDQPLVKVEASSARPAHAVVAHAGARGAKPAQTDWRILSKSATAALIEATPLTGRMHQIRVHMAALGCPILGDPLYGTGALSAPRLMLHARTLLLPDFGPNQTDLRLDAPVPADFAALADRLGLSL